MGSRKSHRPRLETKDALAAPAKVGGRAIGKHRTSGGASFVRPGDIARYVDAQKKMTSASSMLSKLNGDTTSRHLGSNVKFAPDVDVYPTGKNGKRVRPTYREGQFKAQYASVPEPRGIGSIFRSRAEAAQRAASSRASSSKPSKAAGNYFRRKTRSPISPRLVSLPNDILNRVLCCMKHQDIPPIMSVCTRLADVAKTAITHHFNFLTPDAKKRIHRRGDKGPTSSAATSTSAATAARDPGEQNDSQASKAFGSASQPVPMAPFPRQKRKAAKRLSQRKRKEPSRMKKRSLQFNVEASSSSGASSSATR